MASTLNHTQTRTDTIPPVPNVFPSNPVSPSAPYRVTDVVNSATGINKSVFVFKVADGLFDHVATVLDMNTYFDTLLAAQGAAHPYYRQDKVYRDHSDVTLAIDFGQTLISRMTSLCLEYDMATTNFTAGSPETATLPPP